ncbi:MAG TPA: twin-arginine translocase subunit TatC [Aggregatilineales bacterium]|nr:twin-arginine translocase subunit TatC [Aggregatilineales bacterium]
MAERRKFGRGSLTPSADSPDYNEEQSRMSIWSHLTELRNRLVKAMIALVIGTVIGFIAAGDALDILRQPYCEVRDLAEECRLVTLGPTGNMVVYFRVSLLIGAIVSIPIVTYQLLMFIFPGLTRKERRMILLSIPAVTVLFLVGVLFSWFVLMRPALGFLEGFQTDIFRPEWTADLYLSFVTSLVFWMGVAFQTPLILFVLSLIGIVDAPGLRRAWRGAIVGAAAASAFITPTVDPVNMMLVMAPLVGLYIISIFLVMIGQRIAGLQAAAAEANPG